MKRKNEVKLLNQREVIIEPLNCIIPNEIPANAPLFFVPKDDKSKRNYLTYSDEPYSTSINDQCQEYIKNSLSTQQNIMYNMTSRYTDQFSNILMTNVNIILLDGILKFMKEYKNNDCFEDWISMNCYERIENVKKSLFYSIRDIFNSLFIGTDRKIVIHDKDSFNKIKDAQEEIKTLCSLQITNTMYEFINHCIMNGFLDLRKICHFIFNTIGMKEDSIDKISQTYASMTIQFLLELLNKDMEKIIAVAEITYFSTISNMIDDAYTIALIDN